MRKCNNLNTAAYHNLHVFNSVLVAPPTMACKLHCHYWQNILNS